MNYLTKLIKEIIPVIVGILIALFINNWNEDRKERNYLNQILTSINNELEESVEDIKETLPKQQVLMDTLSKYISDERFSILDIIKKSSGLYAPLIKNNSWRAIANTKIELIEFEKLSDLSDLDESKKNLEFKLEKVTNFVTENITAKSQEKKEIFSLLLQELINTEKYLQSYIGELITKYETS